MLSYLRLADIELANAARVYDYVRWAHTLGLASRVNVASSCCACSVLWRMPDTPEGGYVNPIVDAAPWYDATEPASAEFLGLLIDPASSSGDDGQATREITAILTGLGGGAIGPLTSSAIVLDLRGFIVSTTSRGGEYGLRWLRSILASCDACGLVEATIYTACPPSDESDDSAGKATLIDCAAILLPEATEARLCPELIEIRMLLASSYGWRFSDVGTIIETASLSPIPSGSPCIPIETWLCTSGDPVCGVIGAPSVGVAGAIITVTAGVAGATNIGIYQGGGVYPDDLLNPSACLYPAEPTCDGASIPLPNLECPFGLTIPYLAPGASITVDAALRRIVYIGADSIIREGSPYVVLPAGRALEWPEVCAGEEDACYCVSVSPLCGNEADTVASIAYRVRAR